jgi:hypothetical protein
MDSITLDDILGSFSTSNDEREEKLVGIEKSYRREHTLLNYYRLLNPFFYRDELTPGVVIRYSGRIDHISCASRIIKVDYSLDKKRIVQLRLVGLNKGDDSEIWEIYPELYYIFKYNPSVTKIRRDLYKMGITKVSDIKNPDNHEELRNRITLSDKVMEKYSKTKSKSKSPSKGRKKKNNKKKDPLSALRRSNNLDLSVLVGHNPELKSKIIRAHPDKNPYDEHNIKPRSKATKTKKRNYRSRMYDEEIEDDPRLTKVDKITSLLDSDSESDSDTDIPQLNIPVQNNSSNNKWTVELQSRNTSNISELIERRKKATGKNKVKLSEAELDSILK